MVCSLAGRLYAAVGPSSNLGQFRVRDAFTSCCSMLVSNKAGEVVLNISSFSRTQMHERTATRPSSTATVTSTTCGDTHISITFAPLRFSHNVTVSHFSFIPPNDIYSRRLPSQSPITTTSSTFIGKNSEGRPQT